MTMGKSLKFLKSRISVVVTMISIVSWDEKSIPYVYKTLRSSLDGPGPYRELAQGLSNVSLQVGGVQPKISWTAFHIEDKSGTQKTALERYDTINSILPSINHKVNTVDFQYHVMVLNMRYTKYLNPSQTAVSCSDHPSMH